MFVASKTMKSTHPLEQRYCSITFWAFFIPKRKHRRLAIAYDIDAPSDASSFLTAQRQSLFSCLIINV